MDTLAAVWRDIALGEQATNKVLRDQIERLQKENEILRTNPLISVRHGDTLLIDIDVRSS